MSIETVHIFSSAIMALCTDATKNPSLRLVFSQRFFAYEAQIGLSILPKESVTQFLVARSVDVESLSK
jgi:hypothetical protein